MSYLLSKILYYAIIIPISRLPYRILYFLSDLTYFLIYYLAAYRKSVVKINLNSSFKSKSRSELKQIEKQFYRHFCDLLFESFKLFTISEQEIRKRMIFENSEILEKYFKEGRSVIVAGGHYGNWEMFAVACQLYWIHQGVALYKPLANTWFDKVMRATRSQFGLQMVPIQKTKEFLDKPHEKPTATIFGMDQSPSRIKSSHWMKFLGQDTAVIFGTEKYARSYNQPVIFGRILKVRRGYYKTHFELVTDQPQEMPHAAIIEKVMRLLEADIEQQPQWWLWTHRRWKHKKETIDSTK